MAYSKSSDYPYKLALVSANAKLIAHPARITLLLQLTQGPATLAQLAEDHPLRLVSVSNHLRAMVHNGIIQVSNSNQKSVYTTSPQKWPSIVASAVLQAAKLMQHKPAA